MCAKQRSDDQLPTTLRQLRALVKRAESGDTEVLPVLREMLECAPELAAQYLGGDLAETAERTLIQAMAGKNLALQEGIRCQLLTMRVRLAGPGPAPLERLLVDRIVACWLQVQSADIAAIQTRSESLKLSEFHERRRTQAHRRLLSAIRTLASVRKLALPALQLNIGQHQVNVAGGTES